MKDLIVIATILFFIIVIFFGPILIIWALNTLFGLSIQYTFMNWVAAFILMSGRHNFSSSNKKKK